MIKLHRLRREFDDLVVVNDVDVSISEGEIYGLIGPNGAGKTTTIRMCCGLLEPTAGSITIAGVDVHREPERAQQYIGYLSDFFSVYEDLKVWEYLDYFAHAYKMPESEIAWRIKEVIAEVDLGVKRDAMIRGLSRGMKQRLGIARAVIHRPRVLLLDEPASGLDPKARMDLRNLLRSLNKQHGTTVVISSHILTELEGFCTSIGLMERGNMVRTGKIEGITAADTHYRVVRLSWLGDSTAVETALRAVTGISDVNVRGLDGTFKFSGSDADLAGVLKDLIASGVRIVSFTEVKQTVEDIYLNLSHDQVM